MDMKARRTVDTNASIAALARTEERNPRAPIQVDDEMEILERMIEVTESADVLLRPGNYWANYQKRFLRELRRHGLRDFRRRRNSTLQSFGAVDIDPYPEVAVFLPKGGGFLGRALTRMIELLPRMGLRIAGLSTEGLIRYGVWRTRQAFAEKGLDIAPCRTDRIGNPRDVYEDEDGLWSLAQLRDCTTYLGFVGSVDVAPDAIVCEIGPGMGRTAGIMASYHPDRTFVLFDIPPQLYVLNQYLKKRFGDRVVPFERAMDIDMNGVEALPAELRGKIVILPTAKMPEWSGLKIDLFWNSASFQEMEPDIVRNYLRLVRNMRPSAIFISASPGGNHLGPWRPGLGGTRDPIPADIYTQCLADEFILRAEFPTEIIYKGPGTMTYIFERRPDS